MRRSWIAIGLGLVAGLLSAAGAQAHPLVENALDVVIGRERITIDARISKEELLVVETGGLPVPDEVWGEMVKGHADYVLMHLKVKVDGRPVAGKVIPEASVLRPDGAMAAYRFEYAVSAPPGVVVIDQDLLNEYEGWAATCLVRIRQSTDDVFQTALLTRDTSIEFGCEWPAAATQQSGGGAATLPADVPSSAVRTEVALWPTIRAYGVHGIEHILTGYDHLLFVAALVLAATSLWDLVKVVTAFTLAHTLTLALSVFDVVRLPGSVFEPIIAASIVFVAVQNIFWPRGSRGWSRLAVAFAFGLFHGLGFAGELKDAMSEMPPLALWTALVAFSAGVEIGHQMVVIPLFGALYAARNWGAEEPRAMVSRRILQFGSFAISVAGMYYLVQAVRGA